MNKHIYIVYKNKALVRGVWYSENNAHIDCRDKNARTKDGSVFTVQKVNVNDAE